MSNNFSIKNISSDEILLVVARLVPFLDSVSLDGAFVLIGLRLDAVL